MSNSAALSRPVTEAAATSDPKRSEQHPSINWQTHCKSVRLVQHGDTQSSYTSLSTVDQGLLPLEEQDAAELVSEDMSEIEIINELLRGYVSKVPSDFADLCTGKQYSHQLSLSIRRPLLALDGHLLRGPHDESQTYLKQLVVSYAPAPHAKTRQHVYRMPLPEQAADEVYCASVAATRRRATRLELVFKQRHAQGDHFSPASTCVYSPCARLFNTLTRK